MNHVVRNLPPITQYSVEELIERNITIHQRGMEEIWQIFRNTVVVKALEMCDGNAVHAAKLLKVHRNTLSKWMKEAHMLPKDVTHV